MGKLVISENVSLDGVIQDPTGEEGFRFGGWFGRMGDKDRDWQGRASEVLHPDSGGCRVETP
ncbi:hypothetical protein [Nonomuraea dietziae]|uniref:hypothetical protein n=1 Tax=Nonomuraea dietziae TaxID=65515 RepID=UPI0033F8F374